MISLNHLIVSKICSAHSASNPELKGMPVWISGLDLRKFIIIDIGNSREPLCNQCWPRKQRWWMPWKKVLLGFYYFNSGRLHYGHILNGDGALVTMRKMLVHPQRRKITSCAAESQLQKPSVAPCATIYQGFSSVRYICFRSMQMIRAFQYWDHM
jgi:hypothetical protein